MDAQVNYVWTIYANVFLKKTAPISVKYCAITLAN